MFETPQKSPSNPSLMQILGIAKQPNYLPNYFFSWQTKTKIDEIVCKQPITAKRANFCFPKRQGLTNKQTNKQPATGWRAAACTVVQQPSAAQVDMVPIPNRDQHVICEVVANDVEDAHSRESAPCFSPPSSVRGTNPNFG